VHEGDHSILGDEHDHDHAAHTHGPKEHADGHEHTHPHGAPRSNSRLIAGVVVAAAVVLFIVWRFM
jgi:hypothetical protein